MKNNAKQKFWGDRGFVVFIAFLSAFIPLSTDLYLPALPNMAKGFHVETSTVNLTLVLFFVFYAVGMLFWGPLSDRYGRKHILMLGLLIYVSASVLCAVSMSIFQLIVSRIMQAIGSGAVTATGIAIVKDLYDGRKRVRILAIVQSMVMVAPIVAPMLGALLLMFTSWRGVFCVLSITGFLAAVGGLLMEETIGKKNTGNIVQSIGRLIVLIKNLKFSSLLITFSIISISNMAYVSISSFIYQNDFGLSEQVFSFYFAANAMFAVIGPLMYIQISKKYRSKNIITACYITIIVTGLLVVSIGHMRPWVFVLSIIPATLSNSIIRPPATNLMLEQQETDTGAVSSLINCARTLCSSIGMTVISLNWANTIQTLGVMYMTTAVICLILWLVISNKPFVQSKV